MYKASAFVLSGAGVYSLTSVWPTLGALLVAFGLFGMAYHVASALDERLRGRRDWLGWLVLFCALAILALVALGCAHSPVPKEPATVESLVCGGKTCSITTAGPSTVIWVTE